MPTNLPAEAIDAEQRYRAAESVSEKIACLEELLSAIPKHKGTDRLRSDYRRRLSELKTEAKTRKGASRRESAFRIEREGAGRVVIVGPTNVGKSALVVTLTNATPEVADSPFTTWKPTPGMMLVEDIQVQLIDTPPLNRDYLEPEMFDLIRRSDLLLLVVDLRTDPVGQIVDAIALLREHRIVPSHLRAQYTEEQGAAFIPLLVLVNKYDNEDADEDFEILCELLEDDWPLLPISAATGRNLDRMKQLVIEELEIIRVYSKPPNKEPDLSAPFVMKKGGTVEDFAAKVHHDFLDKLKMVRVWGTGVFDGQLVPRDHVLHDRDVVELRM